MSDDTPQKCRELASILLAGTVPNPCEMAALLERAANRIEALNTTRGRLLEMYEKLRTRKRGARRTGYRGAQ